MPAKIEQRIERLEAQHENGKRLSEIVIRFIRPGDMACVDEHHLKIGASISETKEPHHENA